MGYSIIKIIIQMSSAYFFCTILQPLSTFQNAVIALLMFIYIDTVLRPENK